MISDHWIKNGELLLTRYIGMVCGQELIDGALHKSGDIRFDSVRYILSDWTQSTIVTISPEEIKALVSCLRPISKICPNAKMASIVNPDPTGNALVAWYTFLADDLSWDVDIFTSVEEAENWCPVYRDFLRSCSDI
ncbi:hypothetical protein SAMN02745866_03507 [Alteromonadaceae bacterium Bs31]|nr:hypothetical protein SAMN02745866_03507 [Alteromonadaceae bacterium Bs31]